LGHKPGHEFCKHQDSAEARDVTKKDFLDEYNDPDAYRPELPESNRSHEGEDDSSTYLEP
jgi:HNH/ENDO VII superfamily nuclease with conserved GHE residues